jgi:hypothetical protein
LDSFAYNFLTQAEGLAKPKLSPASPGGPIALSYEQYLALIFAREMGSHMQEAFP